LLGHLDIEIRRPSTDSIQSFPSAIKSFQEWIIFCRFS